MAAKCSIDVEVKTEILWLFCLFGNQFTGFIYKFVKPDKMKTNWKLQCWRIKQHG